MKPFKVGSLVEVSGANNTKCVAMVTELMHQYPGRQYPGALNSVRVLWPSKDRPQWVPNLGSTSVVNVFSCKVI